MSENYAITNTHQHHTTKKNFPSSQKNTRHRTMLPSNTRLVLGYLCPKFPIHAALFPRLVKHIPKGIGAPFGSQEEAEQKKEGRFIR